MSDRLSFTKYEHQVLPSFRQRISQAESTEDVKKFFAYTVKELLDKVFDEFVVDYEDLALAPDEEPYYRLGDRLRSSEAFRAIYDQSDLQSMLSRLAETATHRYHHLEKHRDKTESKIRG